MLLPFVFRTNWCTPEAKMFVFQPSPLCFLVDYASRFFVFSMEFSLWLFVDYSLWILVFHLFFEVVKPSQSSVFIYLFVKLVPSTASDFGSFL